MTMSLAESEMPSNSTMSIGAVMTRLKPEFPDVSISKIRFLESEGLVTPHRTPSGYRQFSAADVNRLRYVLAAQRDQYLPLRVIKDHLDAIDRGLEPASPEARLPAGLAAAAPPALSTPSPRDFANGTEVRMTRAELLAHSGLSATSLAELEQFGMLSAGPGGYFDADSAHVASTAAELLAAGLEPRHLRSFRTAADREATLITQLVAAQARQRDPDARERAGAEAAQLAATVLRLHSQLVRPVCAAISGAERPYRHHVADPSSRCRADPDGTPPQVAPDV
jgi:DNA-binding transcriptional MerR regulator